ncbi:hypothetical protein ACFE04_006398 [Oxalis oulophora]
MVLVGLSLILLLFTVGSGAIMFGDSSLPSECSFIVEELKQTALCLFRICMIIDKILFFVLNGQGHLSKCHNQNVYLVESVVEGNEVGVDPYKIHVSEDWLLGHFKKDWSCRNAPKKVSGMLVGGTGIAPMFQSIFEYKVARAILENANGKTNINLIYANVTHSFEGKVSLL